MAQINKRWLRPIARPSVQRDTFVLFSIYSARCKRMTNRFLLLSASILVEAILIMIFSNMLHAFFQQAYFFCHAQRELQYVKNMLADFRGRRESQHQKTFCLTYVHREPNLETSALKSIALWPQEWFSLVSTLQHCNLLFMKL